ncbi:restriction endonuclease [Hymenobacter volaticus]|uniref:DEAD/DEAH box helicase family protein n=1 Tax=Hymenobacter volaticus TaxID=2932254 RepID=A0ABY4G0I0_9BACT|nr:DEAD/DEAH box helicase family protein [Hymenobacter volaticus]UOQ64295.1 DEAD/DEAH box helicase family protein [Hymenobacter volaticus]
MKLQFDSSQDYQLDAVRAVVDVFRGQPLQSGGAETVFQQEGSSLNFNDHSVGNQLVVAEKQLLANVREVQARQQLSQSATLARTTFEKDSQQHVIPLNLTVEMETGTGKTYTYLRTIYELHQHYGFHKFVVVVPSVAIREGVLKNLEITHEHFQTLYGQVPINFSSYDSSRLGILRNYSASDTLQVLVMNIDAFTKDSNIINTKRETGVRPIEYLQRVRPVVIVDEPQNMETDVRRAALANLNPLCLLRYSATHKHLYDLVYSLNPVQAYDRGLVKQIVVDGITGGTNHNAAFVELQAIVPGKQTLAAKLRFFENGKTGVKQVEKRLKPGDDLFTLSNGRDAYQEGFVLNEIDAAAGLVRFSGGLVVHLGASQGASTEDVLKFQVKQTVLHHFRRVKQLRPRGIKVLSLFFIDRVANYRGTNEAGFPMLGKLGVWFEEAFQEYASQPEYQGLIPYAASQVHAGYFSQDKKGVKDTNGTTKVDDDTYNLIMKDKERLLSQAEPVQFIFSHSALREGWDNPNVFQICTLSEAKTALRKRQEIGRGLRLPVDAAGQRVQDKSLNLLTVVANESYESFARALQAEIEEETGVKFEERIKNAREVASIQLTKELTPEACPLFFEVWSRIQHKTRYRVQYSSVDLVREAVEELRDFTRVPLTGSAKLMSETAYLTMGERTGVQATQQTATASQLPAANFAIPDVYAYIQQRVDVTRQTIFEILKQSERYDELEINPQLFLDQVVRVLQQKLNKLLVAGVQYERLLTQQHDLHIFADEERGAFQSNLFAVDVYPEKTLYNYAYVESDTERAFVRDLEANEAVKFFFKLPRGFKIPTPVGHYVPDWVVLLEADGPVYFVAEIKLALDEQRREVENLKIQCGQKHFALFATEAVYYDVVATVPEMLDKIKSRSRIATVN